MSSSCRSALEARPGRGSRPQEAASRRRHSTALLGTVVAGFLPLLIGPGKAQADQFVFSPRVEVGATYNDNYLMSESTTPYVAGGVLVPGTPVLKVGGPLVDALAEFSDTTPTNNLSIMPRVHATFFPGHSDQQSTDGYLDFADTLQDGELTRWKLLASFADSTILASQFVAATFPNQELGQQTSVGSGFVTVLEREIKFHVGPRWSYQWTARRRLEASVDYDHASFSESQLGQVPFQNVIGQAGLAYDWTQRSTLTFGAMGGDYKPKTGTGNSYYGVSAQWDFRKSQIMQMYVRVGATHSILPSSGGLPSQSGTGFAGGIGAHWKYEITDITVDAIRSALPSSFGVLVFQDEARARLSRFITPYMSWFAAVRGIYVEESLPAVSNPAAGLEKIPDRTYATATAGLEWRFTRGFSLLASYNYQFQKFSGDPLNASSNEFGVSVVYEPRRDTLPRYIGTGVGDY